MSGLKQKTYEGYGWWKMMDISLQHNLTKENSDLTIDDPTDPESHWIIRVKPGFLATTY